jgi:4-methyl-5(b-hydroxyethyl)-thiazole monophosphate biosynthesis
LIQRAWKAEKKLAAICAAPSLLAKLGIVNGRQVVSHPFVSDEVWAAGGKLQQTVAVVSDRNLVTGKAAGASIEFGLELVAMLRGRETSEQLQCALFP